MSGTDEDSAAARRCLVWPTTASESRQARSSGRCLRRITSQPPRAVCARVGTDLCVGACVSVCAKLFVCLHLSVCGRTRCWRSSTCRGTT
eukprot:1242092-Rhodomonas_salina.2